MGLLAAGAPAWAAASLMNKLKSDSMGDSVS
jgi:hypothetical protein